VFLGPFKSLDQSNPHSNGSSSRPKLNSNSSSGLSVSVRDLVSQFLHSIDSFELGLVERGISVDSQLSDRLHSLRTDLQWMRYSYADGNKYSSNSQFSYANIHINTGTASGSHAASANPVNVPSASFSRPSGANPYHSGDQLAQVPASHRPVNRF
jgi:hypothetical protein